MGYTTDFSGYLVPNRPLSVSEMIYINTFSETRRMKRDVKKLNSLNLGLDGDYGIEGEYYIGDDSIGVLDHNKPPKTQPGLWCQWIINDEGNLAWDEGEKFTNYVEWLQYLIDNFFNRWYILLSGSINWYGEDCGDTGTIIVTGNKITLKYELD